MSASSVFKAALKVLGPALLGFGTIFQPKANSTDHWSAFPQVTIQVQVAEDESGDPPRRDEDSTVVLSSTAA
jgi:hypothetical protein